jgi:flagellar biosynthesis protein FlhF
MKAPLEVVYGRKEVDGALDRLRHCDAVIVDTPGRTADASGRLGPWDELLRQIQPHEVHLVLPAGTRLDVARHQRASLKELGLTHFLPSKLDHVPGDSGLAELVENIGLPSRWVADGHDVPMDLRPAGPRILTALGRAVPFAADGLNLRAAS